jgi:catechol 2,3-dioxygenase-like lactoylglutathione lyase family enzyme
MRVERIDHLVLTVRDLDATIEFYETVLGMRAVTFVGGRRALAFGEYKINLHVAQAPMSLMPPSQRPARPISASSSRCPCTRRLLISVAWAFR